jgi:hypothetical protein
MQAALPISMKTLTRVPERPRSEGSTFIKDVKPPKRHTDPRPGTYREASTNKTEIALHVLHNWKVLAKLLVD